VIENDQGSPDDPWHTFLQTSDLSVQSLQDYMVEYYRRAAVQGTAPGPVSPLLPGAGRGQGPVLIHCAAGKDRTGVLAALTHHIAGVGTTTSSTTTC
jgi:protein-tyrosine phosphatase